MYPIILTFLPGLEEASNFQNQVRFFNEMVDGMYLEEKSRVHAHFLFNAAVGADKRINKRGATIGVLYQFKPTNILAPDILGMLPYNKLMISMSFPIKKK